MKEMLLAMKWATVLTAITLVTLTSLVVSAYGLTAGVMVALAVAMPVGGAVIWLLFALIEGMVQELSDSVRL